MAEHGTRARYVAGRSGHRGTPCTDGEGGRPCVACSEANAAYSRRFRRLRGYGPEVWHSRRGGLRLVESATAAEHICALLSAGCGMRGIAAASGLPRTTINDIRRGARRHIATTTRARVLGVTIREATLPGAYVDAAETRRLVAELRAAGLSSSAVRGAIGRPRSRLGRAPQARVRAETQDAVRRLHDELWLLTPALRVACGCPILATAD